MTLIEHKLEFIKEQTAWVDRWTDNLIQELKEEDCLIVDSLKTSINWQIGHIIASKYFHTIQSIWPSDHLIIEQCQQNIPLDELMTYYFAGSNPLAVWTDRPSKAVLMDFKKQIDQATDRTLATLSAKDLAQEAEVNNPVARNKYEALTFSFKHQMWHNGQIAMIKRILKS